MYSNSTYELFIWSYFVLSFIPYGWLYNAIVVVNLYAPLLSVVAVAISCPFEAFQWTFIPSTLKSPSSYLLFIVLLLELAISSHTYPLIFTYPVTSVCPGCGSSGGVLSNVSTYITFCQFVAPLSKKYIFTWYSDFSAAAFACARYLL